MNDSTAMNVPTAPPPPTEVEQLRADIENTVCLLFEVAGIENPRAYRGGKLGADMLMKRLEERGWRPEEGWE